MNESQQLLADYVKTGSEAAFHDLVARYVDLVYSAAVRLVNGDTHLAEDVTQTVFADLARMARTLSRDVMLGGWLHRHTCFVASKTMRGERRRQTRERQAVEMNSLEDHSAANLARVAPMLDDAINQLGAEDRDAILLRFFEQHDFKSVGEALGSNEEAARKRVDRALGKLEGLLKRRGVAFSAAALASALSTQAVSAAPAGLAVTISSVALTSAAAGGGTTLTILEIMSMTKLKIGITTAVVAAGVAIPWVMQHRTQTRLSEVSESLRQQTETNSQLAEENARLTRLLASTPAASQRSNNPSLELLRLRGEVGRLRQENVSVAQSKTNGPSALSGITANPEMYKVIRDQQKMGLSMVYKDFTNRVSMLPEQSEQLVNVMESHRPR
jgi:RNA polymerase sigma factor (sigma-70 family)